MAHDISTAIDNLEKLCFLGPAPEADITAAEQALNLTFSREYKEYTAKYGAISAIGVELTGVTSAKRLDVVAVTKYARSHYHIPHQMYVVEEVSFGGMLLLQDETGSVYLAPPNRLPVKQFNSLAEYIETM